MFQVDAQFSNANISRTIRFTDKIFDELRTAANLYQVSFNILVLQCCKYALDHLNREA